MDIFLSEKAEKIAFQKKIFLEIVQEKHFYRRPYFMVLNSDFLLKQS